MMMMMMMKGQPKKKKKKKKTFLLLFFFSKHIPIDGDTHFPPDLGRNEPFKGNSGDTDEPIAAGHCVVKDRNLKAGWG